jgi:hypothetical protein
VSAADPGQPSEEQMRAAYEAELARVNALDMMLQAAVSLLNIAALRLRGTAPEGPGPQGESQPPRDLEQARDAIDGAAALLGVLERRAPQEVRPLRDALSQLQMSYAREVGGGGEEPSSGAEGPGDGGPGGGSGPPAGGQGPAAPGDAGTGQAGGERRRGPAESSGRLWVPDR